MDKLAEILERLEMEHLDGYVYDRATRQQELCDLDNAVIGHLDETDGYNCDACKNKGVVYFLNDTHDEFLKDCDCMRIRRTLRRARQSGLGDILQDYKFSLFETPEEWQRVIKEKAQRFCTDDEAAWFYIGGNSGSGKTHLCTAICAHYIKAGKSCKYMLWRDDAVKLKGCVNDFEVYQKMINEFKRVDVLYIDDFLKVQSGTEPTAADINLAFELLNYRLNAPEKITIISSEFTITDALRFDEATISRIYQKAGDYKIAIEKDIRKNYRLRSGNSESSN